jgi:hypothetical protein
MLIVYGAFERGLRRGSPAEDLALLEPLALGLLAFMFWFVVPRRRVGLPREDRSP